ncbi:MAG TPA: tRNA (guanosine(37)-N1)-methyltransferase TrmD [Acidimicrobiia bacterium]|nr:tRNA (guanosine(37)-N1)-methyltransferase TrmD [Acidimicrobiia bacterium]
MRVDVFTIFPEYLTGPLDASLLGRARHAGILDIRVHDPRTHADDPHRSVDDTPFGGGAGMVMRPEPLFDAVEAVDPPRPLLLLSPSGRRFDHTVAAELAAGPGFSLLCGRYEGVDQRVADHLCDGELSVGDYVLAGGEAAALVVVEAVTRLVPGVLGNDASSEHESFTTGLLEEPQYTRPAEYRGWAVPAVLRSGDHAQIARWRHLAALRRTLARRPDLLTPDELTPEDRAALEETEENPPGTMTDPPPGAAP